MYLPSLDPTDVREEAVVALNPILVPQAASAIPVDAQLSFGQPADILAAYTGTALVSSETPVKAVPSALSFVEAKLKTIGYGLNTSMSAFGQASINLAVTQPAAKPVNAALINTETGLYAILRKTTGDTRPGQATLSDGNGSITATLTETTVYDPYKLANGLLTDTSSVVANGSIDQARVLLLNGAGSLGPRRRMVITLVLPFNPGTAPDARLRLYLRPLGFPLLSADGTVTADPIVSPTVTMQAKETLRAVPPWQDTITTLSGQANVFARTVEQLRAAVFKRTGFFANLQQSVTTSTTTTPAPQVKLTGSLSATGGFSPSTALNRLDVERCLNVLDTSKGVKESAVVIDTTAPRVSVDIPNAGGAVTIDISPLLVPGQFVYTFVVSTGDPRGHLVYNRDPLRGPTLIYGNDWRSPLQRLPGSYLGTIVASRAYGTVPYPIPYFSVAEAKRIAKAWNDVAALNEDPAYQYTLDYNSNAQRFEKYVVNTKGYVEMVDIITGVRIGDQLLFPMGSTDFLWAIDNSDAISKFQEIIFSSSDLTASGIVHRPPLGQSDLDATLSLNTKLPSATASSSGTVTVTVRVDGQNS